MAIFLTINWAVLDAIEKDASTDGGPGALLAHTITSRLLMIGCGGTILFGIVSLIFWLIFSHRVFGPLVPIRRHIEAISKGDFETETRLRKRDDLKELSKDLNELSKQLKKGPRDEGN